MVMAFNKSLGPQHRPYHRRNAIRATRIYAIKNLAAAVLKESILVTFCSERWTSLTWTFSKTYWRFLGASNSAAMDSKYCSSIVLIKNKTVGSGGLTPSPVGMRELAKSTGSEF